MSSIRLSLIGSPILECDGKRIELGRRKALALLAYLALTGKSHPREALATLLWPEAAPEDSRAALRRVLSDLNKALGEGWSEATYTSAGLNPEVNIQLDVAEFHRLLAEQRAHQHPPLVSCSQCLEHLERAVDLYRDHFMTGFSLPDAPAFDEWQFFEGETLRRECSAALETLVGYTLSHLDPGEPVAENTVALARRWAALEPLSENAQAALMQLYAAAGQPSAALRQYRIYLRFLERELDETPSPAIRKLYERIRKNQTGQWAGDALNLYPAERESALKGETTRPAAPPAGILPAEQPTAAHYQRIEEEIRLATALFVGLPVGIQAEWETRPEKVAEAARRLVEIAGQVAARYTATLEQFMGQGMFILFGLPQLHEDDAERALFAAQEIIAASGTAGLDIAVGVSTGQIFYTTPPTGRPADALPMLIGPALNLAARLQNLAASGQILVNPAAFEQTRGAFTFEKNGDAYRLLDAVENPQKARGFEELPNPFIGREAEIERMSTALANVLRGQGQLIAVVGEAGIGKSRLVYELKQFAINAWEQGHLLLWLESRCQEWRNTTSYWPFIDLFHNLLQFFAEGEAGRGAALIDLLEEMIERGDLSAEGAADMGALLGNLLSIRFGNAWDQRLKNAGPEQVQRQTIQAIHDFLVALSHQQPLVLVFEDLHWADDLSLDLLALLMEAVTSHPLLLFYLYRPTQARQGQRLAVIAGQKIPGNFTAIQLQELLPEQSRRLVRCLLGEASPGQDSSGASGLADQLFDLDFFLSKAWGNPFFVEEAIRALVNQGVLFRQAGHWQMKAGVKSLSIPESLQSLILSRVDSLDANLKATLRSASVLGRHFSTSTLAQIVPADIALDRCLWALEEAALIYRQHVLPEVEYAFKHALIQEVVYQTIAGRQRAEMHRLAAAALESRLAQSGESGEAVEQIAYHYQRSPLPEKALEYLLKAGEYARRSYRNREAADYFHQALELWEKTAQVGKPDTFSETHQVLEPSVPRLRWKLAALTGLGQIYHGMGAEAEAEKYLLQAIVVGKAVELDTPALVRLYYWLGESLHWQRRYSEQVHLGQAGLELLAEDQAESLESALMNQIIAIGHLARGDEASFQALTANTASFIEKLPYSEELRPAYVHIILSRYNDRQVEQAERWLTLLHNLAQTHHDLRALAEVYDYQWGYAFQRGNLRQALEGCHRALEVYPQVGDSFRIWRCQRDMAWGHLMCGELQPAAEYAAHSLQTAQELGVPAYQAESRLVSGLVRLSQNELEPAMQDFQAAGRPGRPGDVTWTGWVSNYCLGRALLASGNARQAYAQFSAMLDIPFPYHVPLGWWFNRWPLFTGLLSAIDAAGFALAQAGDAAGRDAPPLPTPQPCNPERPALLAPQQARLQAAAADEILAADVSPIYTDPFTGSLSPGWLWVDPFGDCACEIKDGCKLYAANGRDLWHLNLSAPRLLRSLPPAAGDDFAIQTTLSIEQVQPAIGGLLLWQDEQNFMRLVWGLRGANEISFEGCSANCNLIAGRGWLELPPPSAAAPPHILLRIEKRAAVLTAFCAILPAGQWLRVGRIDFPVAGRLQAGLHAVGWIDRAIHHGAFPTGAAIRFTRFDLFA